MSVVEEVPLYIDFITAFRLTLIPEYRESSPYFSLLFIMEKCLISRRLGPNGLPGCDI